MNKTKVETNMQAPPTAEQGNLFETPDGKAILRFIWDICKARKDGKYIEGSNAMDKMVGWILENLAEPHDLDVHDLDKYEAVDGILHLTQLEKPKKKKLKREKEESQEY